MRSSCGRVAALLLVLGSVGCGTTLARSRAEADIITREQIQQNRFRNAAEAVQALHANWLNVKAKVLASAGTSGQPGVAVYLDETRLSGVADLTEIETQRIQYIRYYTPLEATQRWGVGHTEGAIQVSTQPM